MDSPMDGTMEQDPVHAAAADWFLRLQDPRLSVDDTLAWQQWMGADAAHAHAFRRMEEVWHRFQVLPRPAWPLSSAQTAAARKPLKFALAASVTALLVGGGVSALIFAPSRGLEGARIIETGVGENRTVRLEDGSTVALGGHTRLEVSLGDTARRLTLVRGEALFDVARDSARPFSVRAGTATVTAVGTEFNLRRGADRLTVVVVEGRVLVEPTLPALKQLPLLRELTPPEPRQLPKHLDAGNRAVIDRTGVESSVTLASTTAATAWWNGCLVFDREPLRQVLEDVNRYAAKPVEVDKPALGGLMITGTVMSNNIQGWISSLESAFALEAREEPNRIVLRAR